jgi:hypothetical protein
MENLIFSHRIESRGLKSIKTTDYFGVVSFVSVPQPWIVEAFARNLREARLLEERFAWEKEQLQARARDVELRYHYLASNREFRIVDRTTGRAILLTLGLVVLPCEEAKTKTIEESPAPSTT